MLDVDDDNRALVNANSLWKLSMEQRAQLILFWMARLEGMDARNEVAEIVDKHRQVYIRDTHSTM